LRFCLPPARITDVVVLSRGPKPDLLQQFQHPLVPHAGLCRSKRCGH
jgi:hypothetical protein